MLDQLGMGDRLNLLTSLSIVTYWNAPRCSKLALIHCESERYDHARCSLCDHAGSCGHLAGSLTPVVRGEFLCNLRCTKSQSQQLALVANVIVENWRSWRSTLVNHFPLLNYLQSTSTMGLGPPCYATWTRVTQGRGTHSVLPLGIILSIG